MVSILQEEDKSNAITSPNIDSSNKKFKESKRMNKVNMSMMYMLNIYPAFIEIYKCFDNNIVFAFAQRDIDSHADNNCIITNDCDEEWNAKNKSKTKKERTDCRKKRKNSSEDNNMQPALHDRPKRIRREPERYMG